MLASVFGSVHGFFHSTAFMLVGDGLVLLLAVLWLGLAFRVNRDARRRIGDGLLVGLATALAVAVPFVGPVVYLLFRPPETLADTQAREIELRALRDRLRRPDAHCPVCLTDIDEDFLVCPVCTTRLRESCTSCDAALDPLWQACPYCATPVARTPVLADLDAALSAEASVFTDGYEQQQAQAS